MQNNVCVKFKAILDLPLDPVKEYIYVPLFGPEYSTISFDEIRNIRYDLLLEPEQELNETN
jgi:hypothetical protein